MKIMFLNHTYKHGGARTREEHILKLLNGYASPGTSIEIHYPEDLGGGGVLHQLKERKALSGLHHMLETPALVKKIIEAERNGFDAVVQSNTFDPGVEAARLAVRIPVVGVLRCSCHFTACLCDCFALIVPLETHIPHVHRILQAYRMEHFVTGVRAVNLYESGDLVQHHNLILERTIEAGRDLVAGGAQAIIPLGGRLYPYEVTPEELEPEIGVPIINTKAVGIRFAELMVMSRMMHSAKAYPWSPGLKPEDLSRPRAR